MAVWGVSKRDLYFTFSAEREKKFCLMDQRVSGKGGGKLSARLGKMLLKLCKSSNCRGFARSEITHYVPRGLIRKGRAHRFHSLLADFFSTLERHRRIKLELVFFSQPARISSSAISFSVGGFAFKRAIADNQG